MLTLNKLRTRSKRAHIHEVFSLDDKTRAEGFRALLVWRLHCLCLQKSSFNKFDALSKKTVLHVRSIDAGKVQQQLNAVSSPALSLSLFSSGYFNIDVLNPSAAKSA